MGTLDSILAALRDEQFRKDMAQGSTDAVNRGAVAGTLGAPVDMANTLLNLGKAGYGYAGSKLGLLKPEDMPELDDKPVGGSEWFGQQMQDRGMVSDRRNPVAEGIAGMGLGPLGGAALAERAPQIAAGANRIAANMRAPTEGGMAASQRGAVKVNDKRGAPAVHTSSSTSGDLLPRGGGMYDTSVPQVDLPRVKGKGGQYNERTQALLDNPKATKAIDTLIARGFEINPDLVYWYGTNPLKQAFANEWGGLDNWERFLAHMSSASQRNPVPQQNKMGSWLWNQDVQGRLADPNLRLLTNKMRREGDTGGPLIELPEGYGSLAQGAIFNRSHQLAQGKPVDELLDPKVKLGSFGPRGNLGGNLKPVTVDVNTLHAPVMMAEDPRWLTSKLVEKDELGRVLATHTPRADVASGKLSMKDALKRPGLWESAPEGSEYGGVEELWKRGAKRAGVEPAEGQALGWYGSADVSALKSPPEQYIQNIERLARMKAAATGQKPMKVLLDMLRGRQFLSAAGAGAAGAGAAGAMREEELQ